MKNSLHICSIKKPCRVQIFLGLCLASLFIIFAPEFKSFAYDPIPTPISIESYISLEFDIYKGSSDVVNPYHSLGFEFDRFSIPSSRMGDGSTFYSTFYKYAIQSAIENLNNDKNLNYSISSTVLDLFMSKFDEVYTFDPLCPTILINTFLDGSGNIYFVPDYNTSVLLTGNSLNTLYRGSGAFQSCVPSGLRPFMFFGPYIDRSNTYYFVGYAKPYISGSYSHNFLLGSTSTESNNTQAFITSSIHSYSDFNSLSFYSLDYSNPLDMHCYGYKNSNYIDVNGFQATILYPLVITSNIYTRGSSFYFNGTYTFGSEYYNQNYITYGLNPPVSVTSFKDDFIGPANLWAEKWISRYSAGLGYTNSIIDDPAVLYTPTPFPTLQLQATLTPIILPLDPDLSGISDGNIFGTTQGYIEMLVTVLNGPVPRFFSEVVSFIYASHFTFYIMLFVPIVIFLAFIIGRLHKK